jgi:hypothetical protein
VKGFSKGIRRLPEGYGKVPRMVLKRVEKGARKGWEQGYRIRVNPRRISFPIGLHGGFPVGFSGGVTRVFTTFTEGVSTPSWRVFCHFTTLLIGFQKGLTGVYGRVIEGTREGSCEARDSFS